MSVKIRLQRFGRKQRAYYHIVVADARAPRDGKSIERLGSYNPNTNPATIDLNVDKAVNWLENGAQPTDTCRAILSYKGVLYKHHLNRGVAKGALTQEQADAKFNTWVEEKAGRIEGKKDRLAGNKSDDRKARLAAEAKVNEERAKRIAIKNTPVAEEEVAEEPVEEVTEAVATEETTAEVAVEETPVAEVEETPVAEVEEAPVAEVEETPAAEVEEAPAAEVEETPAAEVEEAPAAEVEETPAAEVEEAPAAEVAEEAPAAEADEEEKPEA